jgi:hypothetical protein
VHLPAISRYRHIQCLPTAGGRGREGAAAACTSLTRLCVVSSFSEPYSATLRRRPRNLVDKPGHYPQDYASIMACRPEIALPDDEPMASWLLTPALRRLPRLLKLDLMGDAWTSAQLAQHITPQAGRHVTCLRLFDVSLDQAQLGYSGHLGMDLYGLPSASLLQGCASFASLRELTILTLTLDEAAIKFMASVPALRRLQSVRVHGLRSRPGRSIASRAASSLADRGPKVGHGGGSGAVASAASTATAPMVQWRLLLVGDGGATLTALARLPLSGVLRLRLSHIMAERWDADSRSTSREAVQRLRAFGSRWRTSIFCGCGSVGGRTRLGVLGHHGFGMERASEAILALLQLSAEGLPAMQRVVLEGLRLDSAAVNALSLAPPVAAEGGARSGAGGDGLPVGGEAGLRAERTMSFEDCSWAAGADLPRIMRQIIRLGFRKIRLLDANALLSDLQLLELARGAARQNVLLDICGLRPLERQEKCALGMVFTAYPHVSVRYMTTVKAIMEQRRTSNPRDMQWEVSTLAPQQRHE